MSSTSTDVPARFVVADRRGEHLDPAEIALQLERSLRGLMTQADPDGDFDPHASPAEEHARRRRLTAFVAELPRTKQLRLAGAANLLDGQFGPEPDDH